MTDLETFIELKRFLLESLKLGNVDKLFIEGSLNTIERSLNALNILKNALTLETLPLGTMPETREEHSDGLVSIHLEQTYNFVRHELDKEYKKDLTEWVIENIDKETVRKWLEEK